MITPESSGPLDNSFEEYVLNLASKRQNQRAIAQELDDKYGILFDLVPGALRPGVLVTSINEVATLCSGISRQGVLKRIMKLESKGEVGVIRIGRRIFLEPNAVQRILL